MQSTVAADSVPENAENDAPLPWPLIPAISGRKDDIRAKRPAFQKATGALSGQTHEKEKEKPRRLQTVELDQGGERARPTTLLRPYNPAPCYPSILSSELLL